MNYRSCVYPSVLAIVLLFLLFGIYRSAWDAAKLKNLVQGWRYYDEHRYNPSNDTPEIEEAPITEFDNDDDDVPPETALVLATLSDTNNSWLENELGDLLGVAGNLYTAIYVVDDNSAPLHTPENKGNEAMAYLTYIIDFYDSLPDISIFMHGHSEAWHNNYLLDMSSSLILRNLNREKVLRDGYMNLRCHWSPGCPDHLHPQTLEFDEEKQEEIRIKDAWAVLFPFAPLPEVLSQPCCSQFAVSRERIRGTSREKYLEFRDWILRSELSDYVTGRVFEYLWQYIFLDVAVFCPDPRICYCDGYGACFEDPREYDLFFDSVMEIDVYWQELEAWDAWTHSRSLERGSDPRGEKGIVAGGPDAAEEGQEVRVDWLKAQIQDMEDDLWRRKEAAFEAGQDPVRRAAAIEAARNSTRVAAKDGPPWWTKRR